MATQTQARATVVRQLLTAELTKSVLLSPQTKHLELKVEGVDEFHFVPGQFVSIKQPRPGGKIHTRAYSIASPPRQDATFDLCLNRIEDGFLSNWLCDLEVGARVQFHGPHGLFTLREPRQHSIFIATGTGIAPIRSMVEWLFATPERNRGHQYWLVFGTRYEHSIYYRDEFEKIARENADFHYVPTLSRGDDDWQGCRGYVQDQVREIVAVRRDMQARGSQRARCWRGGVEAYICGLNQMVAANRKLLTEEMGWERKQIVFERYD